MLQFTKKIISDKNNATKETIIIFQALRSVIMNKNYKKMYMYPTGHCCNFLSFIEKQAKCLQHISNKRAMI